MSAWRKCTSLAGRLKAEALHFFMLVPVGCGLELAESMMLSPQRYEQILNWIYEKDCTGGGPTGGGLRIKATCAALHADLAQRRGQGGGPLDTARRRRDVPDDPRLPGRNGDCVRLAPRRGLPVRVPAGPGREPPPTIVQGHLGRLAGAQGLPRAGEPEWQVRNVRVHARLPGLPGQGLCRHGRPAGGRALLPAPAGKETTAGIAAESARARREKIGATPAPFAGVL